MQIGDINDTSKITFTHLLIHQKNSNEKIRMNAIIFSLPV